MNALAIGRHPDDVEICCAGTLAKCVKRGDRVVTECFMMRKADLKGATGHLLP